MDTLPLLSDADAPKVVYHPEDRALIESMWAIYHPFAEEGFRSEFLVDTQQRFWEMYLTCSLVGHGIDPCRLGNPKGGRAGPDVKVCDASGTTWIEAIAPQHGDIERNPNAVPHFGEAKLGEPKTHDVPNEQAILRYAGAFTTKAAKLLKDEEKKRISADDAWVIAISAGDIATRYTEDGVARILQTLFPIGHIELQIDPQTMKVVSEGRQFRDTVRGVPVAHFTRPEFAHVSAVIFSYTDRFNVFDPWGSDFLLIHNPHARRKLPRGWLKFGTEWHFEGGQLVRTLHPE